MNSIFVKYAVHHVFFHSCFLHLLLILTHDSLFQEIFSWCFAGYLFQNCNQDLDMLCWGPAEKVHHLSKECIHFIKCREAEKRTFKTTLALPIFGWTIAQIPKMAFLSTANALTTYQCTCQVTGIIFFFYICQLGRRCDKVILCRLRTLQNS